MATDWTAAAAAVLADADLTFEDVRDLGRNWLLGPEGFVTVLGRPQYRGAAYPPNRSNPHSRQRYMIAITGPVDSEAMFSVLAHEVGHVVHQHGRSISTPEYEEEYAAERFAHEAIRRHLGREPHPWIVATGRKYVRMHCWHRYRVMGAEPMAKRWRQDIVEWCGFDPGVPLRLV